MADYESIYTGEEIDRRLTDVDNRIALPSPAYAGLFPRGNAQGQVDWVPHGQPTDAQTAAAVSAWLAAHPEATTTVQDGSLTKQKFAPGLVGGANGIAALDGSGKVPDGQLPLPWTAAKTYAAGAYCEHNGYLWHNTSGAASTGVEPGTNYNVWNVTYSNENLLDNWYFGNPVNQRGVTTWSSGYGIDRFLASEGSTTVTADSLSVGARAILIQPLESALLDSMQGKPVTATVLLTDGIGKTFTIPVFDKNTDFANYSAPCEISIKLWGGKRCFLIRVGSATDALSVRALKLELGSVSTLANDAPPNYAEALTKCQRYFQTLTATSSYGLTFPAFTNPGGNRVGIGIALPVTMRTTPVVSVRAGGKYLKYGTTAVNNVQLSSAAVGSSENLSNFTIYGEPSTVLAGNIGGIFIIESGGGFIFSADL